MIVIVNIAKLVIMNNLVKMTMWITHKMTVRMNKMRLRKKNKNNSK